VDTLRKFVHRREYPAWTSSSEIARTPSHPSGDVGKTSRHPFARSTLDARVQGAAEKEAEPATRKSWHAQLLNGNFRVLPIFLFLSVLFVIVTAVGGYRWSVVLFFSAAFVSIAALRTAKGPFGGGPAADVTRILARVTLAYVIASAIAFVKSPQDAGLLLVTAGLVAPVSVFSLGASHALESAVRRRAPKERVLVVGAGHIARQVVDTIATHSEYGLEVVGAVDDDPLLDASGLGTEIVGRLEDLPSIVSSQRVHVIVVAFPRPPAGSIIVALRTAMASGVKTWVVPRLFELGHSRGGGDHLWGLPMMQLQEPARGRPEWMVKRSLDIILAGVALLVLAPLMGLISVLIYLTLGRPVLHRQQRMGVDNIPFTLLKFRSMRDEKERVEISDRAGSTSRSTRLGQVLRRTSLDELPQLLNIVRGEMSLVGPRPERPHFVELFEEALPDYGTRHRLPGGLTGWAQIHGLCGDTSIEDRVAFDNYYIEHWSLGQDLKIMLRTIRTLVRKFRVEATQRKAEAKASRAEERRLKARAAHLLAGTKISEAHQRRAQATVTELRAETDEERAKADELRADAGKLEARAEELEDDAGELTGQATKIEAEALELGAEATELTTELEKEADELKQEIEQGPEPF